MNILAVGFLQQDNDLTKGYFRKTVVGHLGEGGAGVIGQLIGQQPSLPTISHPSGRHSITLLHPCLVPSPVVSLSPYSSAPCGLHVFCLKPQSIISASLGQHSPLPQPVVFLTPGQVTGLPSLHCSD